ncbi:MAG: hypothetical protein P4L46_16325 [Fimbriimonas sp.]|nr:hypothetical protein [Fimbriimonas sp.]
MAALHGGIAIAQSTYTDIHNFGAQITFANGTTGVDGTVPYAGVTFDGKGNAYGTAWKGGAYTGGMVWEITATGVYKDIHDFGGTIINASGKSGPDGGFPAGGVTIDSKGNLYGTCANGNPANLVNGIGMVWEITTSGEYKDLHDFGAAEITVSDGTQGPDGFEPYAGVTIDAAGNLYGTAYLGGKYYPDPNEGTGCGMVWKITSTGDYRDLHDFGGPVSMGGTFVNDGVNPTCAVAFDSKGNMYGITRNSQSSTGTGNLWKLTPSGVYTILHTFGTPYLTDGWEPWATVTIDPHDNLFGTTLIGGTFDLGTVWEYSASGTYSILHNFGTDGQDKAPYGAIALDAAGNMYGTTSQGGDPSTGYTGTLWELTPTGVFSVLHYFGVTHTIANYDGTQGPDGGYSWANVTFDSVGNMYGTTAYGGPYSFGIGEGGGIVWGIRLALNALSVTQTVGTCGNIVSGTVTLSGTAPASGTTVKLTSSTGAVTIPASVVIPAGQTSATFTGSTVPVSTTTTATITASYGGASKTAKLTLSPPLVELVSFSPTSVDGGDKSTGTVTLNGMAPAQGLTVKLSASANFASVPSTLTFVGGATSATFTVKTVPVNTQQAVAISASVNGASQSANLTIDPPAVKSVTLNPTSVIGGKTAMGTVTLASVAPTGGVTVSLASGNPAATIPSTVTVGAGATSATFKVTTAGVGTQTTASITANVSPTSKSASLTINPPALESLTISPSTVIAGASPTGTVTLSGFAPSGGVSVALSSSGTIASAPESVTVAAGASSVTFKLLTIAVGSALTNTITAKSGGSSKTANVTVKPNLFVSLKISPTTVTGGNSITGTVTLAGPAPAGGIWGALSTTTTSAAVPAKVTVPQGATSATFTITTAKVTKSTSAKIILKLLSKSWTATATITP